MGRLDMEKQKHDFIGSYGDKFHSATAKSQPIMGADDEPMSDFDYWCSQIKYIRFEFWRLYENA